MWPHINPIWGEGQIPSLGWHHRALTGQPKCFTTYLNFFSQRLICALFLYDPELEAKEEHLPGQSYPSH